MNNDISFEIIKRNSRGRRYAILVRDTIEINELESILISINKIWGGYQTYLIPYSNTGIDSIFLKMLREMDPDYISLWNEEDTIPSWLLDTVKKFCNPFKGANGILSNCIFHDKYKRKYPHVPIKIVNQYALEEGLMRLSKIRWDKNKNWDYLSFLSLIGHCDFIDETTQVLRNMNSQDILINLNQIFISTNRFTNIHNRRYLPSDINLYGLNKWIYTNSKIKYEGHTLYFILGNTAKDFMYYFNMTRYNSFVFFIDTMENFKKDVDKQLYIFNYLEDLFSSGKIKNVEIIYSGNYSDNTDILDWLKEKLYNLYSSLDINISFMNNAFYCNEIEFYNFLGESERTLFKNNTTLDYIMAPKFEGLENKPATDFRWIAEIELSNYNPIINSNINYYQPLNNIRFSKKGISFEAINEMIYSNQKTYEALKQIPVHYNSLDINISTLLNSNNYYDMISNQGKYSLNIIRKFNNKIDDLAVILKNINYRKIFDTYLDETPVIKPHHNFIKIQGRNYLNYTHINNIIGTSSIANEILTNLITKRILHRGFLIKCEECASSFWISIDEIGDYIKCKQCSHEMFYTYNLSAFGNNNFEPIIYYKLDEVFFKAWINNFDVPILTLAYLKSNSVKNFEYLPEVCIYEKEDNKEYCEIDFICNSDGKLIIGECKSNDIIEESQIQKYRHIASMLGVDEVLFVTLQDKFSSKSEIFIEKHSSLLKQDYGITVDILNKESLFNQSSRR